MHACRRAKSWKQGIYLVEHDPDNNDDALVVILPCSLVAVRNTGTDVPRLFRHIALCLTFLQITMLKFTHVPTFTLHVYFRYPLGSSF